MRQLPTLCLALVCAVAGAEPAPRQLLEEMSKAFHKTDFKGRLVYIHDGQISTLEVVHGHIDGREYERLTSLDGRLAELIRQGDQIISVHPDNTITRLSGRAGVGPLGLAQQLLSSVPEQYQVLVDGAGRIAGRSAWQMRLVPLDQYRYGYRLWIDDESRLLLRSETVDGQGRALERFEFVTLELDPQLSVDLFAAPVTASEQVLERIDPGSHPQGGLQLEPAWLPDGFAAAEADLRLGSGERHPVSARTFSDGLATFTLFAERLSTPVSEGMTHLGPTVAVSRRLDGSTGPYLITLVGEVPVVTAEKVLADLTLRTSP